MIPGLPFSGADLRQLTQNGSPALLRVVGRAFGLGTAEQDALLQGKIPAWLWIIAGFAGGAYAGAYAQKRWPHYVSNVIKVRE